MSRRSDTRETGMRLRDFVIVATTGGVILLFAKYFYKPPSSVCRFWPLNPTQPWP